eukprot:15162254-Alexandrium_andersonii.AAC.1
MSASLVGSEMCIRDSFSFSVATGHTRTSSVRSGYLGKRPDYVGLCLGIGPAVLSVRHLPLRTHRRASFCYAG